MKVLVCGGRRFNDQNLLCKIIDSLHAQRVITEIIHGGAKGADSIAGVWAINRNIPVNVFLANWDRYGRSAGYVRNKEMLMEGTPDMVIAFPGGKGTDMMVKIARNAGVLTYQIKPDGSWS